MTTEEKASSYAWSKEVKNGKIEVWHFRDEVHEMLVDAYLAGAAEALRSQWRDASKELPTPEQDVFVATDSNTTERYGYAWLSTLSNGTVRWYSNSDNLNTDRIRFWLPIPPLPDTQEQ